MTVVPRRSLQIGLVVVVWFAALARGAQDQWAVSFLCGWLSLLLGTFLYFNYKHKQSIVLPLIWHFVVLLIGILISARYSFDINTTRLEITSFVCAFATFFLFSNLFQTQTARNELIQYAGFVVFPLSAIAVMQYFSKNSFIGGEFHLLRSISFSHWSASSTFTNSSLLAGFSLSWILLAWDRRKERYFQWVFAACVLNLLLSRSWWAFISLPIGFMFYYRKKYKSFYPQSFTYISAIVSLTVFSIALFMKFGPGRDPSYIADSRLGWWKAGIRMFFAHPWVGIGLGAYGTAFPFFKPLVAQNTLYAHSFPVQIVSEIGLIGLVGVLLIVGVSWFRLSSQPSPTSESRTYLATLLMLLTFSLTTIFMEYLISKLMLVMVLSLALSSSSFKGFSISANCVRWSTIALILLIPTWYLPFYSSQFDALGLKYEITGQFSEAQKSFEQAYALNPYEDDSCRGLARLSMHRYEISHSLLDISRSLLWANAALQLKQITLSYSEKTK